MIIVTSCNLLCSAHLGHVLSREWRSECSTALLPTKVRILLEVWRHILLHTLRNWFVKQFYIESNAGIFIVALFRETVIHQTACKPSSFDYIKKRRGFFSKYMLPGLFNTKSAQSEFLCECFIIRIVSWQILSQWKSFSCICSGNERS